MSTENTNIENLKESQQIQDPVMEGLKGLKSISTNFSKGAQDEINLAIELRDLLGEDSEVASGTLNRFSGNSMYAPEAVDLGHAAPEDFGESKNAKIFITIACILALIVAVTFIVLRKKNIKK